MFGCHTYLKRVMTGAGRCQRRPLLEQCWTGDRDIKSVVLGVHHVRREGVLISVVCHVDPERNRRFIRRAGQVSRTIG